MKSWFRALLARDKKASRGGDPPFRAGQVWRYRTRPGADGSTVLVTRVETYPAVGMVVHVRVSGLDIPNPMHPSGVSREIGHMPFSAEAVRQSVTDLLRDGETGFDAEAGYADWKRSFDHGEAGVFTLSIADAVEAMAAAVRQ